MLLPDQALEEDPNDPLKQPLPVPNVAPLAMPGIAPPTLRADPAGNVAPPPPAVPPAAPPAAPMMSPAGVTLPERSTTQTSVGPSTTRTIESPQAAIAAGQADTAAEQHADALRRKGAADAAVAGVDATGAQQQADLEQKRLADRAAAAAANKVQVDAAMAEAEKRRAAMEKDAHPTTYWEDKSAASKVLSAFLVGLSTYAHMRAGGSGPGPAYQVLQDQMAEDKRVKLEKFQRSKEFHALAQHDVEAAKAALAAKLKAIDDEHDVSAKMIVAQTQAAAKKASIPGATAAADALAAKVEQDRAENRIKERKGYAVQFNSGHTTNAVTVNENKGAGAAGNRPISEGEAKFAMYSAQMKDARAAMKAEKPLSKESYERLQNTRALYDATEKKAAEGLGGTVAAAAGRAVGVLPRSPVEGLTPAEQRYVVAADNWVNAALRTESGAAIGKEELRKKFFEAMPHAGEDPTVSAQKAAELDRITGDYATLGGRATERIEAARAGAVAPPAAEKPAVKPKPVPAKERSADLIEAHREMLKAKGPEKERWRAIYKSLGGKE